MSKIWFAIWKLAATVLGPDLQVTQRIYLAMQISGEEIWGSVQQVSLETEHEAKNISLGLPLAVCANCRYGNDY